MLLPRHQRRPRWTGVQRKARQQDGPAVSAERPVLPVGIHLAGVVVRVVDVAGFHMVFIVVGFRLVRPWLAKDFASQGVCEKRFHVGWVGGHHQVQQIRCGGVVGDEVGGCLAHAEVQDLDGAGTFPGGYFAGTLGNLFGVAGSGHQYADGTVQDLIHTVQHQIVVVRGQYRGSDLIAAAQY